VIRLDLWEIIGARQPAARDDLPDSLEKPESDRADKPKGASLKDERNRPPANPPESRDR
jgi:hypothetical protein